MKIIQSIHHIAIICSNYDISKNFYNKILGLEIIHEAYREERHSYKLDLKVDDYTQIELFYFPNPPQRPTNPESCGLRHLAFRVDDIHLVIANLATYNIPCEPIRIDEYTGKRFTFFADPDKLPIELYEITEL